MKLKLYTVDAFASVPFTGNPAAICVLDQWLDDSLMQSIAAQNNLAETAFLVAKGTASYDIRWFTPLTEVPLCGHATLASAFVLKNCLNEQAEVINFDCASGPLKVEVSDQLLTLDFPSKAASATKIPDWVSNGLGAIPIEFYQSHYSMAVFPSEEIVAAIEPDFAYLSKISDSTIIITAPGKGHDFVSRFFAPAFGVDEDPVTGSAHCILIPFWAKRLKKSELHAKQISLRGGELYCKDQGDRVKIGGTARLYSEATIHV
ncbi:PhzF family phenazine biosynthesis protein [Pelagicoccus albus]|uniref:PhzF family phenazine biosynthesis protein n=1 Tax=Pelagicoccus albus TaxID=415222 RepID=A0A7X1B6C8_9BACT|nr:PhzF family phenazine biosynthesis protein [Pelagicoccus albus]MBC2606461.1 PhzF family phenazine biosynthesis protein [Pelagicoccus albus]